MAPVSAHDGNICPEAVSEATWSSLAAVLTANTYGLPDRVAELGSRCDELGIPLIEDAAHALETEVDGRPIGSFGAVSIFSLSKHLPGRGGALSLDGEISPPKVARVTRELMLRKPLRRRASEVARSAARGSLDAVGLRHAVNRARQARRPVEHVAWRVPLRADRLERAQSGNGLGPFDQWMETAYPDYRMRQDSSGMKRALAGLRDLERDREKRIAGVLRLRTLDAIAPAARDGAPLALLRVPLLVEDRDAVATELRRCRVNVHFVYDPPLDEYAGAGFAEPSPAPEAARWWGAHVLPVDPHDAERVLELLGSNRIRLTPAVAPPSV
jgi:hypothetical protein